MINNIFKNIDQFIFQRIDQIKNSIYYQRIIDKLSLLDEKTQKIIGQTSAILVISIPIMLVIIIFITNLLLRQEISEKKSLISTLEGYLKQKQISQEVSSGLVSNQPIGSKSDVSNIIASIITSKSITGKAEISNHQVETSSSGVNQATVSIKFNNFSNSDLVSFSQGLVENTKAIISNINVAKEEATQSLRGDISIILFGN